MAFKIVVIGVSAGGFQALQIVLGELTSDFPLPILIVQHTSPGSGDYFARHLNQKCAIEVKEANEKELSQPGTVYLAPANYHLLLERDGTLSLSIEEKVNYARPSIDVLFDTASEAYGSDVIGVILTGANSDGSRGLKTIKAKGGIAIVQDPETAESAAMPQAAMEATEVDHLLPLSDISPFLKKFVGVQDEHTH